MLKKAEWCNLLDINIEKQDFKSLEKNQGLKN